MMKGTIIFFLKLCHLGREYELGLKEKFKLLNKKLILVRLYHDEDDLKFSQSHILR